MACRVPKGVPVPGASGPRQKAGNCDHGLVQTGRKQTAPRVNTKTTKDCKKKTPRSKETAALPRILTGLLSAAIGRLVRLCG